MSLPQTIAHFPIGLAPMEGVTDFALRMWFRFTSAPDFLCTPFLRVTETYPAQGLPDHFLPEAGWSGSPTLPQLMASHHSDFLRVAQRVLKYSDTVELNCGCPAPNAARSGAGSSVLASPDVFGATANFLQRELGRCLAIKMRTGFTTDVDFPKLLSGLADLDLARLTVHGRTKEQGYKGQARWDLIDGASRRVAAPVFASGDIVDHASFRRLLQAAPYLQGLIIGRGALRNPWIFSELRTERPIEMSADTMIMSLGCLALLLEAHHQDGPALYSWSKDMIRYEAGTDLSQWQNLYRSLSRLVGQRSASVLPRPELSRFALGRIKMIWGSMRSSLPPHWFGPQIFRMRDGCSFFSALGALATPRETLTWRHNPDHDWIYSGGGKPAVVSK